MKYSARKDKRRRQIFQQNEKKFHFLRIFASDQSVNSAQKFIFFNTATIFASSKAIWIGHTKNHCILSARCGGILKDFGLSRIKFRELANSGHLPGVSRSSW